MTDDLLDADARSLLDLGRDALGPDAATIARLRGKIEVAVAVAGTTTIGAGIASKLVSAKLAVVAIAVAAVSTIAAVAIVHSPDEQVAPVIMPPPIEQPTARAPTVEHEAPVPAAPVVPPSVPSPTRTVAVTPLVEKPTSTDEIHASLARETELVDAATRAMRANDLAALHTTLQLYASETGGAGQLAEEIDAIEVEALCRARDPIANQRLAAFIARWPVSGPRQRQTLSDACKGSP